MRFNNSSPIFMQIAELLGADILSGRLKAGDRLPSARDLGASLEVNPNTAARALQLLAEEGLAELGRGTGYTVAPQGADAALASRRERFLQQKAPALFAEMATLGISIDELKKHYKTWAGGR